MVVPKYIETQWRGEGKAVLWFHRNPKEDEGETKDPLVAGKITCYMSSLHIREYEEKAQANSEEVIPTSDLDREMKKCPPDVLPEVWHSWLIHWEAWKDIYLPLAWVQKHRDICTSSYIEWHDSYIEEYPEILPIILEGLNDTKESGLCQLPEKLCKDACKSMEGTSSLPEQEKKRDTYDKLYKEFRESRYWIHLRYFLQSCGVQATESLEQFFKESAQIDFNTVENECTCAADSGDILNSSEESVGCDEFDANNDQIVVKKTVSIVDTTSSSMNLNSTSDGQTTFESSNIHKTGRKMQQDVMSESDHPADSKNEKNALVLCENPRRYLQLQDKLNNLADVSEHPDDCHSKLSPAENYCIDPEKEYDYSLFSKKDENDCTDFLYENKENLNAKTNSLSSKSKKKSSKRKRNDDELLMNSGVALTLKHYQMGLSKNKRHQCEVHDSSNQHQTFNEPVNCRPAEDVSEGIMKCLNEAEESEAKERFEAPVGAQGTDSLLVSNIDKDQISSSKSVSSVNGTDEEYDDSEMPSEELISDIPGKEKSLEDNMNIVDAEETAKKISFVEGNNAKESRTVAPSADTNNHRFFSLTLPLAKAILLSCVLYIYRVISPVLSLPLSVVSHIFGSHQSVKCSAKIKKVKDIFHKKLQKWLHQQTDSTLCLSADVSLKNFKAYPEERETQTVYQSVEAAPGTIDGSPCLIINTLDLQNMDGGEPVSDEYCDSGDDWKASHIHFDEDGNPTSLSETEARDLGKTENDQSIWKDMISHYKLVSYKSNNETPPEDLPQHLHKYWAQRHRLFLRYDEGIILDEESWYSVTPEMIAAHQAYRCKCDVVVDAFCGSGGNAIQLAITCQRVIAIDIDARKIELARHNATVYGVEDRIEFVVGDFFKLAPTLKADVVFLSPPWGGTEYLQEKIYNVKNLDGLMNCEELMRAARSVTNNIALYLPRSSNLCQVIELAGLRGFVDLEYNNMGKKRKALTAYYGDLVYY